VEAAEVRALAHPPRENLHLGSVFYALSDLVRLEIVRQAAAGERSCAALDVDVSKSTLSHHLRVLREAGVTRTRIDGTHRYVSLRQEDLDARFPGLFDAILGILDSPADQDAGEVFSVGAPAP
jgi:DNA-binding transcriptional ArsR family regulator